MTELILLGGGGHARSVLAAVSLSGGEVRGYLAPEPSAVLHELEYLGDDDALDTGALGNVALINGLGTVRSTAARRALHERAATRGFAFASVTHPTAFIDPGATLHTGIQILAGAIVNAGAVLHEGVLINSGAIVEHDAVVGPHAHVAPGAVLGGGVRLGAGAFVGLGARVLPGVTVGSGSVVGAGAVVVRDVSEGDVVVGTPARPLNR